MVIMCHTQFAWFRSLEQNTFKLIDFYARRLRRLAPSMYLVSAATLIFCSLYCFPEDAYNVPKNGLLASVFYSNIYLSKGQQPALAAVRLITSRPAIPREIIPRTASVIEQRQLCFP
jgi:peptidoglycan/LPS O-acetylase OafA/YrhL